ncbi:multicopper oxidase [Xylariomycetidae sp. FL2044]|nr:multicopper oxidase [Xylariomycetidae sp. FL2044]
MGFRSLFLLGSLSRVLASPFAPTVDLRPRAVCDGNTASTRNEWCDYSIDTDYTTEAPDTGVTREWCYVKTSSQFFWRSTPWNNVHWLELTDVTVAPDGVSRSAMAVNGTIPGPTLFADWGDTVTVHVTNSLSTSDNGTSIHFHGIRQNYTNQNDGVVSITQCPTPPGDSITYTWRATQYGSSWYHSHYDLQAWEGIFGGIIINGPATANYDEDFGVITLNDWDHQTVDELYSYAQTQGPPTLANGLINGTNTWEDGGSRFEVSVTEGSSYRMRLVNAAIDTHFKFSIDNHTMTVIAADFIPVQPYEATYVNIGMGQRMDVIVTADQASVADNFWIRAMPQDECSDVTNADDVRGIMTYADTSSTPTTSAWEYDNLCDDETDNLIPYISKTVGSAVWNNDMEASTSANDDGLFKWTLNSTSLWTDWENPTLMQISNEITAFDADDAVIEITEAGQWVYLAIETDLTIPHPIHLHGHDFWVLAQAQGTYSSDVTLNLDNPPRRDTAMLPSSGYLVIAFEADNPGAWLMHCHIGWHTSEGFALQFIERYDEIADLVDADTLQNTCSNWSDHVEAVALEQEFSGV